MKNHKYYLRVLMLIIFIVVFSGMLSGCFDRKEVDDLSYVVALGLDKGTTNILKITLQIAVPIATAGGSTNGGGGDGGDSKNSSIITSVESPTIYGSYNMVNNYVSKQLNMSHAKIIVFSEELAREGIQRYIQAIKRGREFRDDMRILVARGTAEEYIKNTKPLLEVNPAKSYELSLNSYKYTAFTAKTQLINFYLQQQCTCSQAVAVLAGVNDFNQMSQEGLSNSTFKEKGREIPLEGDFKAGNVPRTGGSKTEIIGLAVFDGSKMVGELDGMETTYYMMLTGNYNYGYANIPDPLDKNKYVVLNIKQSRKPKKSVKMEGGTPMITAKVKLEADILSIQSGKNYENTGNVSILEKGTEEFLKEEILRFLNKTSKELKSDICGFGKEIKGNFLTWNEWIDFNWLNKYKDSEFDISIDLKIRRPGLMIRSSPLYSTEGEVNVE